MATAQRARVCGLAVLALTIASSWFAMMAVHESGHVLHAWLSGGRVSRVVLHPLEFSRTDLALNPHPLFVAWGGVVWGTVLPVLLWLVSRAVCLHAAFLLRFFAGFCLIANGAYLAAAALFPVGDAEDLLRLGAPLWTLVAPGVAAIGCGLALWNGLGIHFGIGTQAVDP